ncbi:MAG: HyaD/HybD family hydrogenase maturation endopeptidase [Caulobacterales bacterium]|nr:HyaD/HybD family hydrogenase maturation endopeptidase [Caulobacterales bacterium]
MTDQLDAPRILVLGIGNLLWADEAFGVRAVERLNARYAFPDNVTLLDGGTQGLYLVPNVQEADRLIVFDAIDYGLAPGTVKLVRDDEVPKFTGAKKMSLHQTGFQDVLSAADLLGAGYPQDMLLIGVQAERLDDWGGPLSASVRAQVEPAVAMAVRQLAAWGATARPRTEAEAATLLGHGLDDTRFESERPGEDQVWRHGDVRFVNAL